ncbi:DUF4232 domain-containing protein [Streptomyces sp. SL13]|uniref:DUF4232 domain-containing protein n=1 Tax=Streptantibioticus silvisoli TaxID=2705255 RepID=A0AA90H6U0_9ACTN|nr:DUF4232 domain-containing protein [Streptantibioticus silvisoli]MDI5972286.1 DUF4232 domain-containing protein [Streptantibioticus silvisoli]
MASKSTRMVIPAAVLAAAALALTGCSSNPSNNAAGSGDTSAASAPSATTGGDSTTDSGAAPSSAGGGSTAAGNAATTGSGTSTGAGTGTGTSGAKTQAGPAAAGKPCTSSQLTVAQKDGSVGAGQFYAKIVFTNTAATSCTLDGYPGLSYVKAAGVQSGNPAQRTGQSHHTVTLSPHGTASAVMHDSNGMGGYSASQCDLTSVQGLRVYPPNEKAALFIPVRTQHCAGTGIHPLTIGPVA